MKKRSKWLLTCVCLATLLLLFFRGVLIHYEEYGRGGTEAGEEDGDKEEDQGGEAVPAVVSLDNVWVLHGEGNSLRITDGVEEKEYPMAGTIQEPVQDVLADVVLSDGKVTKLSLKPDTIQGRTLLIGESEAEIEGYGILGFEEGIRVYDMREGCKKADLTNIMIGYDTADYVLADGQIGAILIRRKVQPENIRVLIKGTGFDTLSHQEVVVTSDSKFQITYGEDTKRFKAGKELKLTPESAYLKSGRCFIEADGGTLKIKSIERGQGTPVYPGTLEVSVSDGSLYIVNECGLEEYLYRVIPSEMPSSYGKTALEVQAVCARSYAYKQLLDSGCRKYGAHVDDSVSYQVYNNFATDKVSIEAVDSTCGQILTYDGEIAQTYYFSTSAGVTASAENVWLGSVEYPYLVGRLQEINKKREDEASEAFAGFAPSLAVEANFISFLEDKKTKTYDSSYPWYRWQVEMSAANLKKSVDKSLLLRYRANPELVQTLVDGEYVSTPVDSVGDVLDIQVAKREPEGLVTEIILVGSKNTVKVRSEYNIRYVLAPYNDEIVRQDGSGISGSSMLPSAYIVLEKTEGEKGMKSVLVKGGGYGHGVGMSQNGAKSMADLGAGYKEILAHYYPGTEIDYLYN